MSARQPKYEAAHKMLNIPHSATWFRASILTLIAPLIFSISPVIAREILLSSEPIQQYQAKNVGEKIGELIWRGGLVITGPELFGGVSGLTFLDNNQWIMVSDRGQFIFGTSIYDQSQISNLSNVRMAAVKNSKGRPLPPNYSRDAEAIDTIYRDGEIAAIRVGFENLTRVADFDLLDFAPTGPAREVVIPTWISALRTNSSLESVCIAPKDAPISGSTLLLTESSIIDNKHRGWLLGKEDAGEISLKVLSGFNPTDCAFLPDGDLLILERGTGFFIFTMQIRRIKAADIFRGAVLEGNIILNGSGSDIDNMEALAVRQHADGTTRLVIVSDDNFNSWERTLWLEFELVE